MALRVDAHTLAILGRATVNGQVLRLTDQLDRPAYARVAKVIEAAGGRWDRKAQAHLFPAEAGAILEPILLTGEVTDARQELGVFYTPPDVACRVVMAADLRAGMSVLEPSAGRGALAAPALLLGCAVTCVEIDPASVRLLSSTPYAAVVEGDFLLQPPVPQFDRVLMNPPFARQHDVAHVRHAARFLRPGGRLAAIVSAGVLFRTDRRTQALQRLVKAGQGTVSALPDESFRAAGTSVRTALVAFDATPQIAAALKEF